MLGAGVYEIRNTLNDKVYVGSSVNVKKRITSHRGYLTRREHPSLHLQAAWDKYGSEAFVFKQLIVCDKKDILFYEQRIMDGYKANQREFGYNTRIVVESCAGLKLSESHKAKIAASVPRGNDHQYFGKRLSDQAYKAAADLKRGKPMSAEQRAKISATSKGKRKHAGFGALISAAKTGVPMSDEAKKNMSAAKKGRPQLLSNILSRSKLNYEKAAEVRQMFSDGVPQADIALKYALDRKTINNVINNKTWVERLGA